MLALPVVRDEAEVVPTEEPRPARLSRARDVSGRWAVEARGTAKAALDGSVWRARPAALRDIHARTQRGDWAGDSTWLLLAGQVYGYVALLVVAGLYGLAEVVKRPLRLLCALLLVLVPVLVILLTP